MPLVATTVKIEAWQCQAAKIAKINMSELLRAALDAALDVALDFDSVQGKEGVESRYLRAAAAVREQRFVEEESAAHREADRKRYLAACPRVLEGYQKGTISSKGWQNIAHHLNFRNKREAEEYLRRISTADLPPQDDSAGSSPQGA